MSNSKPKFERVAKKAIKQSSAQSKDRPTAKNISFQRQDFPSPSHIAQKRKLPNTRIFRLGTAPAYPFCTPNQKDPLSWLSSLNDRSITALRGKERWIALLTLGKLSLEMNNWVYHKMNHQVESENQKQEPKIDLPIRMEERQFQFDRVIRYLSKP